MFDLRGGSSRHRGAERRLLARGALRPRPMGVGAMADAGEGAHFRDVVQAVTYLKHPSDARRLREKLREVGYAGFPHVLVRAPICRAELLCETEALAIRPRVDLGR